MIGMAALVLNRLLEQASGSTLVGNRQSAIGNRQSAIGNRQSAIGNRQSAIGNRQSASARVVS
jgi:hypothetical protein